MNEITMVRRLLSEPPPDPHVVAEGRERLLGAPANDARAARTTRLGRTIPGTRRPPVRHALGFGVTGAVVAAAVAVAMLLPGIGTSPKDEPPTTTDRSARGVLLAAAERAESAPASGTYWHNRSMSTSTVTPELGRGENRYTVESLSVSEQWSNRKGQMWLGSRAWVRPKSAEDAAAWRRDGSPTKWCKGTTDTEPPRPICLRTAPGEASLSRWYHAFEVVEGRELTFAQLQRLPADPDALRAWLLDAVKDDLDPSVSAEHLEHGVARALVGLLVDLPVPPSVRAGAYRALADMPFVEIVGPARDELGRDGIAIQIVDDTARSVGIVNRFGGPRFRSGPITDSLIIDPDTSHVLATKLTVGKDAYPISDSLILEVGWTDEGPRKPEMP